jgi:epoxyqueuosine reductase
VKIFLHICCAPCAIYPYFRLVEDGFEPQGYFYNPNIHPYQEYRKRLDTARDFSCRTGLELEVQDGYDLDDFLRMTIGRGAGRCEQCYRMRLDKAARSARKQGFTLITTSLLYSKYQNHDLIRGVGEEMAAEQGLSFYYEDFRRGWREGIVESKAMGLYRQQYCGCIFSEWERYRVKTSIREEAKTKG